MLTTKGPTQAFLLSWQFAKLRTLARSDGCMDSAEGDQRSHDQTE